jgi:hypothetical protein
MSNKDNKVVIYPAFKLGEIVYLVTDLDSLPRMVCGYKLSIDGSIMYELITGISPSTHFEQEITKEKMLAQ